MSFLKRILFFFLFLAGVFFLTYKNIQYCRIYTNLGFDGQYGILWNYTLEKGLVPFRDIFYPYGILSYYANWNYLTNLVPYVLYIFLLACVYYFVKKIFLHNYLSLLVALCYVFFLEKYTGMYLVNRYGVSLIFGLFCINLIILKKKYSYKYILFLGFINGLAFGLLGDPGIYCGLLFIFVYALRHILVLRKRMIAEFIEHTIKDILIYTTAFVIGAIPFILFLFITNSFSSYLVFLIDMSNLVTAWKTPLIPFINSSDNIFTLVIFYTSTLYICLNLLLRKRLSLLDYYQIVILFLIFLLEHKSLIKSIDRQMTFVSFFLGIILIQNILNKLVSIGLNRYRWMYLVLVFFFILFIYPFAKRPYLQEKKFNLYDVKTNNISKCVSANIRTILKASDVYSNEHIVSILKDKGNIYSFPGELVWYVLLNSNVVKYPDTYTASYSKAEEFRLEYLKVNKPQYILYNFTRFALIDGVPDYIRVGQELKYILTNYYPIVREGDILILKKSDKSTDFFDNSIVREDPSIIQHLLNVSFGNLPRSEGYYKLKESNGVRFNLVNEEEERVDQYSENTLLLISHNKSFEEFSSIILKTSDGLKTKIEYMNCEAEICIINLDRVPLFYKPRKITSVEFDLKSHKGYVFIKNKPNSLYW